MQTNDNQAVNNQPVNNTEPVNNPNNYSNQQAQSPLITIARLVWIIDAIVSVILAIRFFFILFGANPINGFVNFIYNISYPLARPFFGIFNYRLHYGVSGVEIASLVAIVIYTLIAYLITKLLTIRQPETTT